MTTFGAGTFSARLVPGPFHLHLVAELQPSPSRFRLSATRQGDSRCQAQSGVIPGGQAGGASTVTCSGRHVVVSQSSPARVAKTLANPVSWPTAPAHRSPKRATAGESLHVCEVQQSPSHPLVWAARAHSAV